MDLFPLQYAAPTVIQSTDSTRLVQSVILTGHGSISKIKVTETPLPKDVSDDHVEVKVHYCGLSFTDNYLRLGIIRNTKFPVIMGSECSGYVTRVGKDVTDLEVGQKVLCLQMQGGLFRHFVHVQRKYCYLLPDDISVKDGVALGLNFVVAHICLYEVGQLAEFERVFMQSIAGGVGTALVQLARTSDNARVLGTASRSKHERLESLGLERVFSHQELYEADVYEEYSDGVDIVVNTSGWSDFERCLLILKPAGRLVLLGSNSTATYPNSTSWGLVRPKWDSGVLSSATAISWNYSVTGVNIGVWLDSNPEKVQRSLSEIFRLYSSGKIKPYIHVVLPFDQVAEGIEQLCKRENFGKVMLEVKQEAAETQDAETSTCADPQTIAVAVDEPEGKTDPDFQKQAPETPAVEILASADAQPETAEPKEKADLDTQQEEPAPTHEPKVAEPSHHEEPEEKVAEGKTEVGAP